MNQSEMTLSTLRKITDFPFYTARYRGDYKIEEFISGAKRLLNKVAVYQESFKPPSAIWSALFYPRRRLMKVRPGSSIAYYNVRI